MIYGVTIAALAAAQLISSASAQSSTWCGKNYMPGQAVVAPGGEFATPEDSADPLLAFRCTPAFRPYLQEDESAAIVVDAPLFYKKISGAYSIDLGSAPAYGAPTAPEHSSGSDTGSTSSPSTKSGSGSSGSTGGSTPPSSTSNSNSTIPSTPIGNFRRSGNPDLSDETLDVEISWEGQVIVSGKVGLNTTGTELYFDLKNFYAQNLAYNLTCSATYSKSKETYKSYASLLYLPTPTTASVVKTDLRTSGLWAKPANGSSGPYAPVLPYGFYSDYSYLIGNLSSFPALASQGFNTIHPIPPYGSNAEFQELLTAAQKAGLYVVYDMRDDYMNLTSVASQVFTFRSAPNLLTWYTAHEPDGNSYPFNSTTNAYSLIYEIDGYHPVSIVLNCQDYYFEEYAAGADIIAEDAYPIGINATYSPVWHTVCDKDFGHCGCDNCVGSLVDIRSRIGSFTERLQILGWDRTKTVWAVPQAFGSAQYWSTTPTGQEWAEMHILSIQHGGTGAVSFSYPTTNGTITTIEGTANGLGFVLSEMAEFIFNPDAEFVPTWYEGVDLGLWKTTLSNETQYLLTGVNINGTELSIPWEAVGLPYATINTTTQVSRSFSVSQNMNASGLNFRTGGIGAYILNFPLSD